MSKFVDSLVFWLPVIVGLMYLVTSISFWIKSKPDWALVYFAYALANVGLVWTYING